MTTKIEPLAVWATYAEMIKAINQLITTINELENRIYSLELDRDSRL